MNRTAAILLSRQPLRPCRRRKWLIHTVMAFGAVRRAKLTLLSSYGMQTWDILTALASLHGLRRKIFIPAPSREVFERTAAGLSEQFALRSSLTEFVPVRFDPEKNTMREALVLRDERIVSEADLIVPVSIKSGGNMAGLLRHYPEKELNDAFRTEYQLQEQALAYVISEDEVTNEIKSLGDSYLFHWTRTFDTAWPDETMLDYYRAVLGRDRYPRTAFDSLVHILDRRKLYASRKHRPANLPAVSFTGLEPKKLPPLMRWRARYRQMAFEPYGIGIEKRYALDVGIEPVLYYDKKDRRGIAPEDLWRSQSRGEITDWRREKEYRYAGDFDLNGVPREKLLAVCRFPEEAERVQSLSGIKTVPFVRR